MFARCSAASIAAPSVTRNGIGVGGRRSRLLDLVDERAGTEAVQRPAGQVHRLAGAHGMPPKHAFVAAAEQRLAKLCDRDLRLHAGVRRRAVPGVDTAARSCLDREHQPRVDELRDEREPIAAPARANQLVRVALRELTQGQAGEASVDHGRVPALLAVDLPRLRDATVWHPGLADLLRDRTPAEDVVAHRGRQSERIPAHRHLFARRTPTDRKARQSRACARRSLLEALLLPVDTTPGTNQVGVTEVPLSSSAWVNAHRPRRSSRSCPPSSSSRRGDRPTLVGSSTSRSRPSGRS